jgi:uncharacterized protein
LPVVSAELFTIPLDARRFLVYAPLRQAAFVANARTVNFIASLRDGRVDTDADPDGALLDFLRRLEIVDGGDEPLPLTPYSGVPEATAVTLFLTTTCNLRCTYCYASAGDTRSRSMTLATAQRGIDFVVANARRRGTARIEINYHGGGEPTGNWKVMTASLGYAVDRSAASGLAPPLASAASNGVLRDDQIDWLIAHMNGGVSVSFDGLPAAHDRHRLTVNGHGSSRQVMHTLRRFDAARYPYGVRVTVTADQIAQLPDSIEFICREFGTPRIQVEPAYQLGRWRDAPSAETADFIAAYRAAQERAARYGREIFFSAARLGSLSNHFCGVTQDTFALSADGNVSACYEVFSEESQWAPLFFYGQPAAPDQGYEFDLQRLDRLRGQSVEHREFCRGCFARWNCSGDCYHKAVSVTGSLEFEGTDRCHITRELTRDQILARIAAGGGLLWHEPARTSAPARGKESLL